MSIENSVREVKTAAGNIATNVVITEEIIGDAIATEVDTVANTEAIVEEAVSKILTTNTAPIICAVTQPKKNIAPPRII